MDNPSRVVGWDIEATGLKADFAFLLCAAFGVVGEKKITLRSLRDYGSGNIFQWEKNLVYDVLVEMGQADLLVSYFGTGYDHPFMNAKAIEYGFPVPPPIPRCDLFFTAKSNLAISRKSMQNVAYFSNASHEKTPVEGKLWKAAMAGSLSALKQIEKHNVADVQVLNDVYIKLRPLVRMHPRVAGAGPCRYCGSLKLQNRGFSITTLQKPKQRVHCQNCGGWDLRAIRAA